MKTNTEDVFPVYSIKDNCFITVNGDITFAFKFDLPEIFSLSESNIDDIHTDFFKFCTMLPVNSIVHKQDINLVKQYTGYNLPSNTFLEKATKNYFKDRHYIDHNSFLYITLSKLKSLNTGYDISNFLNRNKTYKEDTNRVINFTKEVDAAIKTLNSSQYLKAVPVQEDVLRELFMLYFNGFEMGKLVDIEFKPDWKIGKNYFNVLALVNEENKPENLFNSKIDTSKSTDKYIFHKFLTQGFGLDINCNHIVNQILYIDDHFEHKTILEKTINEFHMYSEFNTHNKESHKTLTNYMTEIVNDDGIKLTRGHFNVIYWADTKSHLESLDNEFISKFRELDIFPYSGNHKNFVYFYLGSCPGRAGLIPSDVTFRTDLAQGVCFFSFVSNYKSDPKGVVFNERLYNLPIIKDLWDEPYRTKQITARNFIIVADTGSGKSFVTNHIFRQYIEQDYSLMLVDIGDSYEGISQLYRDKIAYIKYRPGYSLGINPLKIESIDELKENDKLATLTDFIFIHWKKGEPETTSERVSMNMIIADYYQNSGGPHRFPDFYRYVKGQQSTILKRLDINPDFLHIDEFIHVCSEYVTGIYDFLYDNTGVIEQLEGKQAAIFELSSAFERPDILPIMFLMIRDTINTKIWNNTSSHKALVYEECKSLFRYPSMVTAIDYTAQTVRKHDGGLGLIVQTIDNFPDDSIGKAMFANTHTYYIFEPKTGVASLKEKLDLSPHELNQILSVRSNLSGDTPYTEFALKIGNKTNSVRLEVPKEAAYAYLSEKSEKNKIFALAEQLGSYELAINKLVYNEKN